MGKICSKLCPKSNIDQNLLLESLDRYDTLLSNLYDEPIKKKKL